MFRELAHDDDLMHRILLLAAAPEVAALLREHPAFRNLPQSWQAHGAGAAASSNSNFVSTSSTFKAVYTPPHDADAGGADGGGGGVDEGVAPRGGSLARAPLASAHSSTYTRLPLAVPEEAASLQAASSSSSGELGERQGGDVEAPGIERERQRGQKNDGMS
jgi:hypothetical protein